MTEDELKAWIVDTIDFAISCERDDGSDMSTEDLESLTALSYRVSEFLGVA